MAKQKFYVVWKGRKPGVYRSWDECKAQVHGFAGPVYKAFETLQAAETAFGGNAWKYIGAGTKAKKTPPENIGKPLPESICVDAAWNSVEKDMEYQGIYFNSGKKIFHKGPFRDGTNNVGEFLAIVHALAYCKKHGLHHTPIYSDSRNAIGWVRAKKCNTKLEATPHNAELFDLIDRALQWLKENAYQNPILKWETKTWGENPADFGRK